MKRRKNPLHHIERPIVQCKKKKKTDLKQQPYICCCTHIYSNFFITMIKADLKQQPYEHYLGILSNSCEKPITKTYVQPTNTIIMYT